MNVRLDFPDELVEAIATRVAEMVGTGKVSPLMTVTEAADYLRCQPKRVYDLTSQRRIDFVKDGSRVLVRREALDRYLNNESENK